MSSVGVGLGIGAGVGVSSVALAPFNAANTFLGSSFFGYGMILGERYMYQNDWPKIQARLEGGEQIENIIQEYTGVFTAVVMKEAKIIFDTVTREFISIMNEALRGVTTPVEQPTGGPTIGDPRRTPAPQPTPAPTIPEFERSIPRGPPPTEKIINVPKVKLKPTNYMVILQSFERDIQSQMGIADQYRVAINSLTAQLKTIPANAKNNPMRSALHQRSLEWSRKLQVVLKLITTLRNNKQAYIAQFN